MNKETTLCFTGPRKIDGKYPPSPQWIKILNKTEEIVQLFAFHGYKTFISGGALGFDQIGAAAVVRVKNRFKQLGIELVMALPFQGFESKWPKESQAKFLSFCNAQADQIIYVSSPPYAPWKMQARNKWMVDRSKAVVALWNRIKSGGTFNCIFYALLHKKEFIYAIDPMALVLTTIQRKEIE